MPHTPVSAEVATAFSVTPDGLITVRTSTRYVKDGRVDAESQPHTVTLVPGDDLAGQPKVIQVVGQELWTDDVVAAHKARVAALNRDRE